MPVLLVLFVFAATAATAAVLGIDLLRNRACDDTTATLLEDRDDVD